MNIEIKNELPKVSIIAVSYNHARWLVECMESIRAQTYKNIELIYLDDASTDSSARIACQWLDSHFPGAKRIVHEKNRGLCATLNEGLRLTNGHFVQFLACDDKLEPLKLESQLTDLNLTSESTAFAFGNFGVIDESSQVVTPLRYPPDSAPPEDLLGHVLTPSPNVPGIAMLTALIKKSVLEEIGSFDETLSFEGIQLWVRILPRFSWIYCPRRLGWYRVSSNSFSHNSATLRHIKKDIIRLMDILSLDPSYQRWAIQIQERKRRAIEWLINDAIARNEWTEADVWLDRYLSSNMDSTSKAIWKLLKKMPLSRAACLRLLHVASRDYKVGPVTRMRVHVWLLFRNLVHVLRSATTRFGIISKVKPL